MSRHVAVLLLVAMFALIFAQPVLGLVDVVRGDTGCDSHGSPLGRSECAEGQP